MNYNERVFTEDFLRRVPEAKNFKFYDTDAISFDIGTNHIRIWSVPEFVRITLDLDHRNAFEMYYQTISPDDTMITCYEEAWDELVNAVKTIQILGYSHYRARMSSGRRFLHADDDIELLIYCRPQGKKPDEYIPLYRSAIYNIIRYCIRHEITPTIGNMMMIPHDSLAKIKYFNAKNAFQILQILAYYGFDYAKYWDYPDSFAMCRMKFGYVV